jgi:hypothetical protein
VTLGFMDVSGEYEEHAIPDLEIEGWPPVEEDGLRGYMWLLQYRTIPDHNRNHDVAVCMVRTILPAVIDMNDRRMEISIVDLDAWCREFVGPEAISRFPVDEPPEPEYDLDSDTVTRPPPAPFNQFMGLAYAWEREGVWLRIGRCYFFKTHALGMHFKLRWWG